MNKTIIDVKNLWKLFSFLVLTISMLGMLVAYYLISNAVQNELDIELKKSLASFKEQIVYGNYRDVVEMIAADPNVLNIEIIVNYQKPIQYSTNRDALIKVCASNKVSNGDFEIRICKTEKNIIYVLLLIFVSSISVIAFGYFYLTRIERNAAKRIKNALIDFGVSIKENADSKISIFDEMKQAADLFKASLDMEIQIEKLKAKNESSEQVAHDIRSPLAALEMLSLNMNGFPEDQRLILRSAINRIKDIANTLGQKSKKISSHDSLIVNPKVEELHEELLLPIIDLIITEKRIQYRDQLSVQIELHQSKNTYGMFSKVEPTEFKRLLSNLINNSVEALTVNGGAVIIELSSYNRKNVVEIKDTGKGIPEFILKKLGARGATFQKDGGSGLGLFHAKSKVESWGGSLEITSKANFGTTVKLFLPQENAPDWFVAELKLNKNDFVVVFDDDQTIHQIWTDKLVSAGLQTANLLHLSTPAELREFCGRQNFVSNEVLFLMDYEILNHRETGLDMIEELKIQSKSILVTSRYEEIKVRDRCDALGVKFIPKSMSGFVPIQLND